MKKYPIPILHCLTTSLSLFLKAEMTSKYSLILSPYSPLFSSLKTIMLIQKESLADFCKYIKETYTLYGSVNIEKQNLAVKTNLIELKKVEKDLIDSKSVINGLK